MEKKDINNVITYFFIGVLITVFFVSVWYSTQNLSEEQFLLKCEQTFGKNNFVFENKSNGFLTKFSCKPYDDYFFVSVNTFGGNGTNYTLTWINKGKLGEETVNYKNEVPINLT